ncbi:MAG: hypothetical protein KTR20_00670 [Cellvibrionaceae bacterium]|nr:hypothetical protein [Cellvibrionaceae bacterium]
MSTSQAEAYYQQGALALAIKAAADTVKQNPADEFQRIFFVELLCVSGDYERADAQLHSLMTLKPDLTLELATWRQLIHAAQMRKDVFDLKAKPELIDTPTEAITLALDTLIALHENDDDRLAALLEKTNAISEKNSYQINGSLTQGLRDLDDTTANLLEVLATNGKYFWIDYSQVVELNIEKPTRVHNVLWRKASIVLTNGTEGEVYLPSTYIGSCDDESRLGKKTQWQATAGIYQGAGLKIWLCGDDELTLDEIDSLASSADTTSEIKTA